MDTRFDPTNIELAEASQQQWDVIIIGAGMGGSVTALGLARGGKKVLLIEKGRSAFSQSQAVVQEEENPEVRLESGRWPTKLTASVDGVEADVWAPLGCGVGGSTLLYAAALQRLKAEDFGRQLLPDGSAIEWPYSYEDIQPYYQQAETLFSVCGSKDPLDEKSEYSLLPPPAMSETDQHLFQEFEKAGANPYHLHTAIKYEPPCSECSGQICVRACKQDASTACLSEAIATQNLFVLSNTEVERLNANAERVESIEVIRDGQRVALSAQQFVLSAGAYFSPVLLLKSASEDWPNGLANSSDQVGRNLMFHASDFIAVWPKQKNCSRKGPSKTIAFRDLYSLEGKKLGEFQSTGSTAAYGNVVYALRLMFDQSRFRKLGFLRHFLRIPAYIASKLFGEASVFATIVEDFPYAENRILVDENAPSGMRFEYWLHDEFRERVLMFRKRVQEKLDHLKTLPMATNIALNYGHPCGTCKAGDDPKTSVVDANCKSHDLDNLYIVDASFMPTSGGTNPSLTVAANALRVAEAMLGR